MIQGKPTVSPQLMLSLIYRSFPDAVIDIDEDHDNQVVKVSMARNEKKKVKEVVWSMKRAQEMGLTGKDNWRKQPVTMLKWRAVSDCARVVFPDVVSGIYTVEEFDNEKQSTTYTDDGNVIETKSISRSDDSRNRPSTQNKVTYIDIMKVFEGVKGE